MSDSILAGRNPVLEALRADRPLEKIFILYGVHGRSIETIRRLARQKGVPCVEISKQKFRELADRFRWTDVGIRHTAGESWSDVAAQGVAAVVGTKRYLEVDELLAVASQRGQAAFLLLLDGIEDPQNLGALIRTAECAGVHGVIIPKHHAATVSTAVGKASAGASEHVPIAKVTNLASCLDELKSKGIWVVGAAMEADRLFTEIDYAMPIALVIGSEGKGMRKLVKEKCDFLVKIPLYGKIGSLNASVAGALLMYEAVRKREKL